MQSVLMTELLIYYSNCLNRTMEPYHGTVPWNVDSGLGGVSVLQQLDTGSISGTSLEAQRACYFVSFLMSKTTMFLSKK